MKFTLEQKKKAYELLTEEERGYADSLESIEFIRSVGEKVSLSEEHIDLLESLVNNVQLKLQTLEDLEKELLVIHIPQDQISIIVESLCSGNIGVKRNESKKLLDEGNEHLLPKGEATESKPVANPPAPQTTSQSENIVIQEEKPPQGIHLPEKSAVEKKLAELRKLGQGSVLEARYSGQDPYREPLE